MGVDGREEVTVCMKDLGIRSEIGYFSLSSYGFPQNRLSKRIARLDNAWLCDPIILFHIQ